VAVAVVQDVRKAPCLVEEPDSPYRAKFWLLAAALMKKRASGI